MILRESLLALIAAIMPIATISVTFPSFEFPNADTAKAQTLLYFNLPLSNACFNQGQYRQWTREGTFYTRLVYKIRDGDKACRAWWQANLPNQDIDFALSLLEK